MVANGVVKWLFITTKSIEYDLKNNTIHTFEYKIYWNEYTWSQGTCFIPKFWCCFIL